MHRQVAKQMEFSFEQPLQIISIWNHMSKDKIL